MTIAHASRREFLRRHATLAGLGGLGVAAPWAMNMADDVGRLGTGRHRTTTEPSSASSWPAPTTATTPWCRWMPPTHKKPTPTSAPRIALPLAGLDATEVVPTNPWPDGRRMALHPSLEAA